MSSEERSLREELEQAIWECDADALQRSIPSWEQRIHAAGRSLRQLLAELSDETLVRAIQKAVFLEEAFTELFKHRYEHWLVSLLPRWGVPPEDTFDMAQTIFFRLFRTRIRSFSRMVQTAGACATFRGYLYVIARNHVRRALSRARPVTTNVDLTWKESPSSLEEEVLVREMSQRLDEAMAQLPGALREVMEAQLAGERPAATAARLELPVTAVYRLLHSARQRLAAELGIVLPPSRQGRKPGAARGGIVPSAKTD